MTPPILYKPFPFPFFQLTLWSGLKELSSLKKRVPLWFKHLMLRASMLGTFVMAVMVLRVKIMKAELPVFTV